MKFTKKLLSLLLAITMLFTITTGVDLSAYAAGWADYAQEIELNTVYSESASTTDCSIMDGSGYTYYYDSFLFNVPAKGNITLNIESEEKYYTLATTNYTVQYYIYKANDVDNYIWSSINNGTTYGYSSGRNLYYGSFDFTLNAGVYFLVAEYSCYEKNDIIVNGIYDFSLSYKPSIATPTLKATVNANGSFKLSWNKVAGAEKYELYIKQANGSYKLMKTTTATSFTTAFATYGKQYSYKMRAVKGNAKSAYSAVVNAKNTKKLQAPTAKVTVNANGSFKISWNKVTGATKYGIYMKQANGSYKWIKTVTGTSWSTAVAAYGKQYSYKVLAANNNKSAQTFSNVVNAKNTKKLTTPSLKATVNKNGSIKLSWGKVAGATSYQIYMKQSNGSYKLIKTTTSTSFTTAVASKGKTYSYKVRAVTSKNKNATSNYSKVVSAKRK